MPVRVLADFNVDGGGAVSVSERWGIRNREILEDWLLHRAHAHCSHALRSCSSARITRGAAIARRRISVYLSAYVATLIETMAENSPAKDEKEPAKSDVEVPVGEIAPPPTVGRKPLEGRVIRGTKGES